MHLQQQTFRVYNQNIESKVKSTEDAMQLGWY